MATTLKPVDAVVVGFGWTGAILAKELTEAGLNVVALERGENRDTYPDGAYPNTLDELTYNTRGKLFQNLSKSTVSIRHGINDTALPYRQLSAFLPGDGVGGAGLHWSGVHFRIMPEELRLRSHYEERYGKNFIPEGMTIQDYGVSYEELEPHFDFAEKVFGTSGTAHTVKGQVVGKGNPFAADRSDDFPLPALRQVYSAQLFRKAAEELGLHPYDLPAANASGPWTNPYGVQMGPCNFCGFCSGYACYMYSKASPNLNILPALRQTPLFELRANCNVLKINLDSDGRQATGVTYVDAQGREIVQPAKLVIISAFQFHNVRLLLLSGIGKPYDPRTGEGVVGKNFAYQNMATIKAFFDKDVHTNPFVGTGGGGVAVDDFNADNFDHGPLGFVGGSPMWVNQAGSKPIGGLAVPPGTPSWGSGWKQAVKDAYTHTVSMDAHGSNMTYRDNYLDLDPTYKDAYGQPHVYDESVAQALFHGDDSKTGAALYVDNCGACHRTDGKGYARVFPALAGNPVVTGSDPTSLVHIVLKGGTLPATHQAPSSFTMPPFGWRMNDQEIADVVNFIRTSWGNQAPSVSVDEVRRLRKDTGAAAVGDIPPPGPAAADRG
ncbi:c-type cytochrome [Pseudomonas aeruginosa]|uniref:c-type cytochrome n=4 Tax=Gammaproteobacteria TaxID=1236 RepID=UPI00136FAAB9|nr:c-type cytochrome [Pseudomonas aeruginosa]MYM52687.1 c-type cytochrome [Pseudomonas aeruginosa]